MVDENRELLSYSDVTEYRYIFKTFWSAYATVTELLV